MTSTAEDSEGQVRPVFATKSLPKNWTLPGNQPNPAPIQRQRKRRHLKSNKSDLTADFPGIQIDESSEFPRHDLLAQVLNEAMDPQEAPTVLNSTLEWSTTGSCAVAPHIRRLDESTDTAQGHSEDLVYSGQGQRDDPDMDTTESQDHTMGNSLGVEVRQIDEPQSQVHFDSLLDTPNPPIALAVLDRKQIDDVLLQLVPRPRSDPALVTPQLQQAKQPAITPLVNANASTILAVETEAVSLS